MTGPNFASILDEEPTEIIRPEPLPVGTYTAVVGMPRYDKSAKKKTDFVEFPLKLINAHDDVDDEALAQALGDAKLSDREQRITFYLTEDAAYRLDEFHEHCGIDLSVAAKRRARNEAVVNQEVGIVIKHTASDDGTRIYANIARTVALG